MQEQPFVYLVVQDKGQSHRQGMLVKMSKSAWVTNCNTDFQTILGPVFTLFRCFGIEFHEPSTSYRFIARMATVGWMIVTLGTCGYQLLYYFPIALLNSSIQFNEVGRSTTSFLHWAIEYLNLWIYMLAAFIGSWCMAR